MDVVYNIVNYALETVFNENEYLAKRKLIDAQKALDREVRENETLRLEKIRQRDLQESLRVAEEQKRMAEIQLARESQPLYVLQRYLLPGTELTDLGRVLLLILVIIFVLTALAVVFHCYVRLSEMYNRILLKTSLIKKNRDKNKFGIKLNAKFETGEGDGSLDNIDKRNLDNNGQPEQGGDVISNNKDSPDNPEDMDVNTHNATGKQQTCTSTSVMTSLPIYRDHEEIENCEQLSCNAPRQEYYESKIENSQGFDVSSNEQSYESTSFQKRSCDYNRTIAEVAQRYDNDLLERKELANKQLVSYLKTVTEDPIYEDVVRSNVQVALYGIHSIDNSCASDYKNAENEGTTLNEDNSNYEDPTESISRNRSSIEESHKTSHGKSLRNSHNESQQISHYIDACENADVPMHREGPRYCKSTHQFNTRSMPTSEMISKLDNSVSAPAITTVSDNESSKVKERLAYESVLDSMDVARLQEELDNLMGVGSQTHPKEKTPLEIAEKSTVHKDRKDFDVLSTNSRDQFVAKSSEFKVQYTLAENCSSPTPEYFTSPKQHTSGDGDTLDRENLERIENNDEQSSSLQEDDVLKQGFVRYLGNYVAEGVRDFGRSLKSNELLTKLVEAGKVGGEIALMALPSPQTDNNGTGSNTGENTQMTYQVNPEKSPDIKVSEDQNKGSTINENDNIKVIKYTIEDLTPADLPTKIIIDEDIRKHAVNRSGIHMEQLVESMKRDTVNNRNDSMQDRSLDMSVAGDSVDTYMDRHIVQEFEIVNQVSSEKKSAEKVDGGSVTTPQTQPEYQLSETDSSMGEWNKLLPNCIELECPPPQRVHVEDQNTMYDSLSDLDDEGLCTPGVSEYGDSLNDTIADVALTMANDSLNANNDKIPRYKEFNVECVYDTDDEEEFDHERYDDIDKLLNDVIAGKNRLKKNSSNALKLKPSDDVLNSNQ